MTYKISFVSCKTNEEVTFDASSFFCIAVIPKTISQDRKPELTGINVGIAIPHKDIEEYKEFRRHLDFNNGFIKANVSKSYAVMQGDAPSIQMKVPVYIHDGNAYDEAYGSSCLFGYISPLSFDERPLPINPEKFELGSLHMVLGN